jgi:hypothetical protein
MITSVNFSQHVVYGPAETYDSLGISGQWQLARALARNPRTRLSKRH